LPPGLTAQALCDELSRGSEARRASETQLATDQKALADERVRLEKLAADVEKARQALRAETARLEALLKAPPRPAAPPASTTAPPAGPDAARVDRLARTLQTMKPEQLAQVLAKMDVALGAQVLARLGPAAGPVMDRLKPEQTAALIHAMANASSLPEVHP
jgi:flagellar motility protein MotE (MotC chaperone)